MLGFKQYKNQERLAELSPELNVIGARTHAYCASLLDAPLKERAIHARVASLAHQSVRLPGHINVLPQHDKLQ